ncbi:PREDICTED: F-box protein At5g25290-like [Camelina sativa]|uniref:F-box protein At5g25290-like n=1 Tax=Camelina sativa TaxID=90675 RepID=A0ABM0TUN1_CAMSA|nr:PREDICTED: F-box protein At5g25290-like [Camelina sativa]
MTLFQSSDLQGSYTKTYPKKGCPGLMLFPKKGGCALYNTEEGKIERYLGDFPGHRFLANSGNWFLVLDSESNLYIIDVFSQKRISLPSLESIRSSTSSIVNRVVGDTRRFVWKDSERVFEDLSSDLVRGLLWVDESGKEFVVVWFFDLPGHAYICFCKQGDTHYTDIPLFHRDSHWLDGLSEMVLQGYRLYITTNRRYVRVLDLSGQEQGFYKDITDGTPFPMLSRHESWDSSIAVTTSGEVLLVESDPCNRTFFRLYKKNLNMENPDASSHTVLEVDSLGGEALFLDLGFTVPANASLGIEPDSIYFTRHYRPCHCTRRDLDICVYNLANKTIKRVPLGDMDLMDARWFLRGST